MDQLLGAAPKGALLAKRSWQREGGREETGRHVAPCSKHGIVEDGQRAEKTWLLEGAGDAKPCTLLHRVTR